MTDLASHLYRARQGIDATQRRRRYEAAAAIVAASVAASTQRARALSIAVMDRYRAQQVAVVAACPSCEFRHVVEPRRACDCGECRAAAKRCGVRASWPTPNPSRASHR